MLRRRNYIEKLESERQAAQTHARTAESTSINPSQLDNRSHTSVTLTDPSRSARIIDANERAGSCINAPMYPEKEDERTRLRSYRRWPTHLVQTPQALAQAGLFYIGDGDQCKCFWCGGILSNWQPNDVPWVEHARLFPQCGFVRQQKGDDFVDYIKIAQNIESPCIQDFLRRPHVLVALNDFGYTREQVLEALCTFGALKLSTTEDIVTYVEDLREKRQVWSARGQPIVHPSDQDLGSTVFDERRQPSNGEH